MTSTAPEPTMAHLTNHELSRRYRALLETIKPYQSELFKKLACTLPRKALICEGGNVVRIESTWDEETQRLIDAHHAMVREIAKCIGLPVPPSATEEDAPT